MKKKIFEQDQIAGAVDLAWAPLPQMKLNWFQSMKRARRIETASERY